jgi:hypothetical protein
MKLKWSPYRSTLSHSFPIQNSMKQRNALSSLLFNFASEVMENQKGQTWMGHNSFQSMVMVSFYWTNKQICLPQRKHRNLEADNYAVQNHRKLAYHYMLGKKAFKSFHSHNVQAKFRENQSTGWKFLMEEQTDSRIISYSFHFHSFVYSSHRSIHSYRNRHIIKAIYIIYNIYTSSVNIHKTTVKMVTQSLWVSNIILYFSVCKSIPG